MRFRVVLALAGLALFLAWTPVAQASTFPDLPGMGSAEKATAGKTTKVSASSTAPAKAQHESVVTEAAKSASADTDTSTISEMPGGGSVPVIGEEVEAGFASTSKLAEGSGLVFLAGLGSFAALAWLLYLRRAGVL